MDARQGLAAILRDARKERARQDEVGALRKPSRGICLDGLMDIAPATKQPDGQNSA